MPNFSMFLSKFLLRKTSGRKLIPEIDGLRSIAILSVVIFHANANFDVYAAPAEATAFDQFLRWLLPAGEYGVPLFFTISGFILALPFATHHLENTRKPALDRYFTRRLTRLEPPYIICMLALAALRIARALASNGETGEIADTGRHLLAHIFYLHSAFYGTSGALTIITWSLEVEVQFYLLAPLLCTVFMLRKTTRRLIIVAATLATSWFFGVEKPINGLTILNHLPYFLTGLLLADVYVTRLRDHAESSRYWNFLAPAAIAALFLSKASNFAPALLAPWLIFIAYFAVFNATSVRRFFAATPVVALGGMCYSIYLWHFFIIIAFRHPFFQVFEPAAVWPMRLAYIATASTVAILLSSLFFVLVERPTMDPKWPTKLAVFLRLRPPDAPPTSSPPLPHSTPPTNASAQDPTRT